MVADLQRICSVCRLVVVFAILAGSMQAQTATTASKNPSPELVSQLTKKLSISPAQATGGAGALFGLAKNRLSGADFGKIAAVVPGMNGFLKAASSATSPAAGGLTGISSLSSALPGGTSGLASTAQQFQKLGLSPDMISKFVPVLTQFVQSKGGTGVASLLSGVFK